MNRLLGFLGYTDSMIKTKESIDNLALMKGSKSIKYKPDYVIMDNNCPVVVIDAKSTTVNIDNYIEQCAHYCLILNRRTSKSVKYFVLSNGILTKIFKWDEESALLELSFEDFVIGNAKFEELCNILSITNLKGEQKVTTSSENIIKLKRLNKEEAQKIFRNCHKYIWNTEKRGPNSAFIEFVKLIFLKLYNDKNLHAKYHSDDSNFLYVPAIANIFSKDWIERRENDMVNPVNDIQFRDLMQKLNDEVRTKKKKVLFDDSEVIELKAATIKGVVEKLERYDLYGIDEDLNGRLFETFLNATMRGADLGQFFTPRSIVLLGTLLADLKIDNTHIDTVLDASCGTGGYLIEALTIMRQKVRDNNSYTDAEKQKIIDDLCYNHLFGVDAAKDPKLARIARINMYLHGDGGSHIYLGDGLDKKLHIDKSESKEFQYEIEEMANYFKPNSFDVVLTNPPFSMWYEQKNEAQDRVLSQYELINIAGSSKKRNRLRGSAMFIERYCELLKPGGKLITVIDETVLSSQDYLYVREYILRNFIVRAVISLHGDAFQQSKARVKTAMLYLTKKTTLDEMQSDVFMCPSIHLGVDDLPITTKPSTVILARKKAESEIKEIIRLYGRFRAGERGKWSVDSERIKHRFDIKYCIPEQGRFVDKWQNDGYDIVKIDDLCQPREEIIKPRADFPDEEFRILTIKYSGRCNADEVRTGEEIQYAKMMVVRSGDIVISAYNAFHGAVGYITDDFDGALASSSYFVLRCNNTNDSLYLWSILRSTEIRADILTSAVGMGRQTVDWSDIKNIKIPVVSMAERIKISSQILYAWQLEKDAQQQIDNIGGVLDNYFGVESDESKYRFIASKPPK